MPLDDEILEQLMASFREELAERLATINTDLLALEQRPHPDRQGEIIEDLFRHVHSLKGAARAVQIKPIEEMSHGLEDVFGAAKRGSIQLTADLFDLLYQGIDLIGVVMAAVDREQDLDPNLDLPGYLVRLAAAWRSQPIHTPQIDEEVATPGAPALAPLEATLQPWTGETVRVPTTRLDELMAQSGELLVTRLRIAQQTEEVAGLQELVTRWQRDWQRLRGGALQQYRGDGNGTGSQLLAFLEHNDTYLTRLADWIAGYSRRLSEDLAKLALVADGLQEGVKQVRMLPLATLLGTCRRVVRDLARDKEVEVALEVEGASTEMDKHVLEELQDPLMHLLRNCIDHGIEPPEERERRGKDRRGMVCLRADRQGNTIVVQVSDDGAGIDTQAVRDAAVRRGLLTPIAAAELSVAQVRNLIFAPDLSTSPIITEVSGRGIGLDVVRKNVEGLQGRVEVESKIGVGTTFTLILPLTLVSTRCLLLRVAGQVYAVPISAVERIEQVERDQIVLVEGREAIRYHDLPLALVRMADVLDIGGESSALAVGEQAPAVILSSGGRRIAFLVDEVQDENEVVVKSLGKQLARVPNVAGATVLSTGQVGLILNVADLVKSAQRTRGISLLPSEGQEEPEDERKRILIVDDSITTRTLEKNILTTAGYEVRLATDGQEAMGVLMEGEFDLIVADVDMPRMDGFELTQRVKQDQRYHELPVILVTSMGHPEHKARGIEVGADAYIIKGSFDQDVLLETIRQLI